MNLPPQFEWATDIELGTPEVYRLSKMSWPRFLLENSDIPDPILKFQIGLHDFKERFKIFGVRERATGLLVAFIQAVHVEVDLAATTLPDLGWRFSLQNAAARSKKNAMSLVEASIDTSFRGHGLSRHLIDRVKSEARLWGFTQVVAPVRPTFKTRFPLETMVAYCGRRDERGRIFDPWLRTHVEAGAAIVSVCNESVRIEATLARWREWTGLALDQTESVLVDGGLMPLWVDIGIGRGVYIEPNVWVRYDL